MTVHTLSLSQDATPALNPGEVLILPIPHDPYTLRIVIPGTSRVLNSADKLRCNYPAPNKSFDRNTFIEYDLDTTNLIKDVNVEIQVRHSGSFTVEIGSSVKWDFVVASGFKLKNQRLTANSLCVQTLLSKLVDPGKDVRSTKWRETLEYVAQKNYNMIHFVPLQPRGESGSPFSIADQLGWDKTTFPGGEKDIQYLVDQLEELGILGLTDIVLNHTASDSFWLKDHVDAGYSPETAPHLQVAVALDDELLNVDGLELKTIDDIDTIIPTAVKQAAERQKLWEFYVVNVNELEQAVKAQPFQGTPPSDLPGDLKTLATKLKVSAGKNLNVLGPRFYRSIDTSILAEYAAGTDFDVKEILDEVNASLYAEYNDDLDAAITSIRDRQKYLRIDSNGPQIGFKVNKKNPLIESYFNRQWGTPLACNGWVWGGNPLIDHAGPQSKAYIRRELIVWGDCVKLRYGSEPADSPYLWSRMSDYARLMAKHFSGLRLDNAHSTPIHVGEYILDQARKVRPNLYVVAELFSGSQELDKLYVERLGITSLLREAIMPGNPKDFSTVIHANGGLAIGSFKDSVVRGTRPHAWLMEVTHDNETMAEKRTVEDTLSTAGLVAMCQVASGCTLGNDEAYAEALNVVSEERLYKLGGGICKAKAELNKLHQKMGLENMVESYTDLKGQYITVHRVNPETGKGVFLVARSKFWEDAEQALDPIKLEYCEAEFGAGWSLVSLDEKEQQPSNEIRQLNTSLVSLDQIKPDNQENSSTIHVTFDKFPQGSVAFWYTKRTFEANEIEQLISKNADDVVADLNLLDLNALLYHAEGEERACSEWKRGVYSVPNHGKLVYAGLQGFESLLNTIVSHQNLGHPLCQNLREGLWAFEYVVDRVNSEKVKHWIYERLEATRTVPNFLRPRYFAATILTLYEAATNKALKLMKLNPNDISEFFKKLALTSVQMVSRLPNCSLFPNKNTSSMAAGLPHFSEGAMRCWGRDVFLSVGGLLIRMARFEEAKQHILGFGATLKYGLIPNLLDSGSDPRYNARDAAWFFVQCIQDYCKATDSLDLLREKTQRRFPLDDTYTDQPTETWSTVGDLVYEILSRHAAGIKFREHNAGRKIDMHMNDNGFNQHIWTDWSTGIVFGGSQDNCGTWQDKMGESELAKSDGVPATPRDGAAIEITAMLKSCLRWVNSVRAAGGYDWPESVKNEDGEDVQLTHWESLLQNSFEKCYFVPESRNAKAKNGETYDIDWNLVNRQGIYKDCYKSGKPYEDYQFRPNFTVAVVVAPELFASSKIYKTLQLADKVLRGPVGMATLDPSDWNYRPYYLNSIESADFATSKGRNYHQGPEWVWLAGTFLQAYVQTMQRLGEPAEKVLALVRDRVQGHLNWIKNSPWSGLTELTQKSGELCGDSSPTQAWSSARLIEAICSVTSRNK